MLYTPVSECVEFAGHGSHDVALLSGAFKSCQVPTGHNVHSVIPATSVKLPCAQVVQLLSEMAAKSVENLPAAHRSQLVALPLALYEPAAHAVHS